MKLPREADDDVRPDPRFMDWDDIADTVVDEVTPYGRDPFDVIAALEEDLGEPLRRS